MARNWQSLKVIVVAFGALNSLQWIKYWLRHLGIKRLSYGLCQIILVFGYVSVTFYSHSFLFSLFQIDSFVDI
jgi:hypothetical protein